MPRPRMGRGLAGLLLCIVVAPFGSEAAAQSADRTTRVQIEQFEPLHSQQLNILNVHGSETFAAQRFGASLFLHYVDDPFELRDATQGGDSLRELVHGQLRADLTVVAGVIDRLELAATVPFVLYQHGDDLGYLGRPGHEIDGAALGDVRLTPKVQILVAEEFHGFGLAAAAVFYVPSGDSGTLNSDGAPRFMPQVIADWRHEVGVKVALNIGYQIRPRRFIHNVVSDDQVKLALGVEGPTGLDSLKVQGAVFTALQVIDDRDHDDLSKGSSQLRNTPAELDLGVRWDPIGDLHVSAGFGFGMTKGVGAPDWRTYVGVEWSAREAEEAVAPAPEPPAADVDTDGDGLADSVDRCPGDAEDRDGFEDADGCPDTDDDADGVPDGLDGCPRVAEDRDGFQDTDGCPDFDDDGDGVPDATDACPREAEDVDRFEDSDGCPEPDNDQDGVLDAEDICPTQPETMNGIDDGDGCPDREGQKVRVTRERIVILEKVQFASSGTAIDEASHALLTEVAAVLRGNPQITKVRVEGHTDGQGPEAVNLKLSQARAEMVEKFMVDAGIAEARLVAVGYGEMRPIASNETKAGRAENRRVAFTVVEIAGQTLDGADETGGAP